MTDEELKSAATGEDEEDIVLADLPDDELVEQMHDDLYDGLKEEVVEGTEILLARGWSAEKVLNKALVEGMRIVGVDFRDGILFVPEVLLAANSMKGGMELLRPLLAETGVKPIGKMVIGTVKGDIHDKRRRCLLRGTGRTQTRHSRHVGIADPTTTLFWSAERRSTKSSARPSAPTVTAGTRLRPRKWPPGC
jgi:hypothetical protein